VSDVYHETDRNECRYVYLLHLIRITVSLSILGPVRYIVVPLVQRWSEYTVSTTKHITHHHHHHQQQQQPRRQFIQFMGLPCQCILQKQLGVVFLKKIHVQMNTKSVQCLFINT